MPAVFVSIPGCSHCWQLERPDTVADELTRARTFQRPLALLMVILVPLPPAVLVGTLGQANGFALVSWLLIVIGCACGPQVLSGWHQEDQVTRGEVVRAPGLTDRARPRAGHRAGRARPGR